MSFRLILSALLNFILVVSISYQQCNTCNTTSGFACFSDTQYFTCNLNGVFNISSLTSCPLGVCNNALLINPCTASTFPSCPVTPVPTQPTTTLPPTTPHENTDLCNICNSATGFACFSDNQYFRCDANGAANIGSLTACITGVCDSSIAQLPCSLTSAPSCPIAPVPTLPPTPLPTMPPSTTTATPVTSTAPPTTTTTVRTTTTVAPPFNATAYCINFEKPVARYQLPGDSTCKKYVNCYLNNGLKGRAYTCTGILFNPILGACDPNYTTCVPATSVG